MHKIFAAVTITALAMAGSAAVAETVVGPSQAKVKALWAQQDDATQDANPIAALFALFSGDQMDLADAKEAPATDVN